MLCLPHLQFLHILPALIHHFFNHFLYTQCFLTRYQADTFLLWFSYSIHHKNHLLIFYISVIIIFPILPWVYSINWWIQYTSIYYSERKQHWVYLYLLMESGILARTKDTIQINYGLAHPGSRRPRLISFIISLSYDICWDPLGKK